MPLLGKQLDGIWHTGIVAYGKEFYFGGMGIENCPPSGTMMGQPDSIVDLGVTQIPHEIFMDYLQDLANSTFRPECYHLLEHNCNTFSSEIAQFLTGNNIPAYITSLPQDVLNTPFGAMIKPFLDAMTVSPGAGGSAQMMNTAPITGSAQINGAAFPTPATTVTSPAKPAVKAPALVSSSAASSAASATLVLRPPEDQTVVYNETQIVSEFLAMRVMLGSACSADVGLLDEIVEYISSNNCQWGLSPFHIRALERSCAVEELSVVQQSVLLGLLQLAVLKQDTLPVLAADRQHGLMALLTTMENRPQLIRRTLAKTLCNSLVSETGYKWCMQEDEWTHKAQSYSNQRCTLQTSVTCLLSDDSQTVEVGSGIAVNLACRKDIGDVHVEVGSALIQALQRGLQQHTTVSRCLLALYHCMHTTEVCELAGVMGLDVQGYESVSPAAAHQVQRLQERMKKYTI